MQSDEALRNDLFNKSPSDPSSCRVNQEDVSRAGKLFRPILSGLLQTARWLRSWLADLFVVSFATRPSLISSTTAEVTNLCLKTI
jgi:hypothetical protein